MAAELITRHQRDRLRSALVDDAVVVVPHFGGYVLAALLSRGEAIRTLGRVAEVVGDGTSPMCVVGRPSQAASLSSDWDINAQGLTERMWPGPLTVGVSASAQLIGLAADDDDNFRIAMASSRIMRTVVDEVGPLLTFALSGRDGVPVETAADAAALCADVPVTLVVDGGRCGGLGATVVDCTHTPPVVRRVGRLPESYVDAVLIMGAFKRRRWFSQRKSPGIAGS
ncbi:MAG TPA: Sua5/YciO/YrdC/YwlC family protein [Acidimicrobiales bacterium]